MYSAKEVADLVRHLHVPKSNIWCFTGFLFEELDSDPDMATLRDMCSHIVEGPFEIDKRDVTLRFRGSTNQRIFRNTGGDWVADF